MLGVQGLTGAEMVQGRRCCVRRHRRNASRCSPGRGSGGAVPGRRERTRRGAGGREVREYLALVAVERRRVPVGLDGVDAEKARDDGADQGKFFDGPERRPESGLELLHKLGRERALECIYEAVDDVEHRRQDGPNNGEVAEAEAVEQAFSGGIIVHRRGLESNYKASH